MQCILENSSSKALRFIGSWPLVLIAGVRPAHYTRNLEPRASLVASMLCRPEQNSPRRSPPQNSPDCCSAAALSRSGNQARVHAQETAAHERAKRWARRRPRSFVATERRRGRHPCPNSPRSPSARSCGVGFTDLWKSAQGFGDGWE